MSLSDLQGLAIVECRYLELEAICVGSRGSQNASAKRAQLRGRISTGGTFCRLEAENCACASTGLLRLQPHGPMI
jgi:hypothetical protein